MPFTIFCKEYSNYIIVILASCVQGKYYYIIFSMRDAVILAGATRLRPVLLTAVTTILGLLPMVIGVSYDFHVMAFSTVSESSEWWRSMAAVVIFGLAIATVLTLLVVPSLYVLIEDIKSFLSTQWSQLTDLMPRQGSSWIKESEHTLYKEL